MKRNGRPKRKGLEFGQDVEFTAAVRGMSEGARSGFLVRLRGRWDGPPEREFRVLDVRTGEWRRV